MTDMKPCCEYSRQTAGNDPPPPGATPTPTHTHTHTRPTHTQTLQLVLLGEASHGTAEFYAMRAELSKMLVGSVGVAAA
jgi:erythromycin esterase-like protein